MNADPKELEKFNDLAGKWWEPGGDFAPLHELNPLRLSWIESIAPVENRKVADIGCGGGILSEALAKKGARVTGIDLAEETLKAARQHAGESGLSIDYRRIPAETLAAEEPGAYDIVTCMEMLEHVPDPRAIVNAASRLVRPGGTVFFATINRNLKSFLHAIVGAEYILSLLPKGTHDHGRFITPAELSRHARNCGLEVTAMTGVGCSLTGRHFHLKPDVSVNYMMACVRPLANRRKR